MKESVNARIFTPTKHERKKSLNCLKRLNRKFFNQIEKSFDVKNIKILFQYLIKIFEQIYENLKIFKFYFYNL